MSTSEARLVRIPIRVVIGVTGHRKLADEQEVLTRVREALEQIRRIFPDSPGTPVVFSVLSPLAEGADRLVASRILETPGAKLDVVLPCAQEEYLEDFRTPESQKTFDQLLRPEETSGSIETLGEPLRPGSFEGLRLYNQERAGMGEERQAEKVERGFVEAGERAGARAQDLESISASLFPHYLRADSLAQQYQKLYVRAGTLIPLLAAAAVIEVIFQALYLPGLPQLIFLEVGFMAFILGTIWLGNRRGWHRRWIDYRFLAERFRSAAYLSTCGAFAAMRSAREHNKLAMRAKEIERHLTDLKNRIQETSRRKEFLQLVRETEELMQQENAEWRVMIRFRPPELPA